MKLSRERKLYVAVLGLGAAALMGDRLFLAPAGADAAPSASAPGPLPAPLAPPRVAPAPPPPSGPSFAERTRAVIQNVSLTARDPFQAGERWPRPKIQEESQGSTAPEVVAFCASHKLTTVYGPKAAGLDTALINGTPYRVGATVDGYRLVEVDSKGVWLESPSGERQRLELPKSTTHGKNRVEVHPPEPSSDR